MFIAVVHGKTGNLVILLIFLKP